MATTNNKRITIASLCVSAACLAGIAGYEGYRGEAYKDSVGVPTIGYGETKGVKMGDKTTPERALATLLNSTEAHADKIRSCIKVPLTQYEFDAYVSLSYNIGTNAFCNSTLVKKLNQGDYAGACEQIKRWDYAGGKKVKGLTNRRNAEYKTCIGQ